jgi:hypothetical protein
MLQYVKYEWQRHNCNDSLCDCITDVILNIKKDLTRKSSGGHQAKLM